jgi:hypothetical protein
MSRFPSIALALVLVGTACASSTPRPDAALRDACARDPKHDERCVPVLTGGADRETREEVLDREAERQGDDFRSRIDKLRAEEEERQRQRAKTSTAAEPDGDALLAEAERATGTEELDSGTSVRAIRPATDQEKKPIRDFADVKIPKGDAVKKPGPRDALGPKLEVATGPTPEGYLRGASCLLGADVAATKALVVAARRTPPKTRPSEAELGQLALVLVDADGVLASVRDELAHRGLPEQQTGPGASPNCTTRPISEVVDLLRSLVGPPVAGARDVERYQRGLVRLRTELELRAGLPKGK